MFEAKHLSDEQTEQLFRHAIQQLDTLRFQAYLNWKIDGGTEAQYQQACDQLEKCEKEYSEWQASHSFPL